MIASVFFMWIVWGLFGGALYIVITISTNEIVPRVFGGFIAITGIFLLIFIFVLLFYVIKILKVLLREEIINKTLHERTVHVIGIKV